MVSLGLVSPWSTPQLMPGQALVESLVKETAVAEAEDDMTAAVLAQSLREYEESLRRM